MFGENIPEEMVKTLPLQGLFRAMTGMFNGLLSLGKKGWGDETKRHQNGQMALGLVSPHKTLASTLNAIGSQSRHLRKPGTRSKLI